MLHFPKTYKIMLARVYFMLRYKLINLSSILALKMAYYNIDS